MSWLQSTFQILLSHELGIQKFNNDLLFTVYSLALRHFVNPALSNTPLTAVIDIYLLLMG